MKKTQIAYRYLALMFVAVFVSITAITSIKPEIAEAATDYSSISLVEKARAWVMGRAISECIASSDSQEDAEDGSEFENENRSESDMNKGKWLNDGEQVTGGEWSADIVEGDSDDAVMFCDQAAEKMLDLMGYSAKDALCEMNDLAGKEVWERERGDCRSGTGDFDFNEGENSETDTNIWNRLFAKWMGVSKVEDALTNGMRYLIYRENFFQECSRDHGKQWNSPREWASGDTEDKYTYKLKWNLNRTDGNTAGADKDWYVVSGGNDNQKKVWIDGFKMLFQDDNATCEQLAERINDHADDYLTELQASIDDGNTDTPGGGTGNNEPTCQSEGGAAAWFLCEILEVADRFIAFLDRQISSLLFIDRDVFDNETIDTAWSTMRNLALLILVPMMMFMVIGTALNFGPFDPYTVKKALPRMFVAVILISISLPLTQFAVQVSNAAGQGLGNIILSASPNEVKYLSDIFSDGGGATNETLGWGVIVAGLAGFAVAGIGALLSLGLVTIAGLLIGFIVLVMRQVLLIALMVIAPLAILVWIFPGNDKLWGVWKGTFIAMLLMYPIIAVLLATGKFVAGILG